MTSLAGTARSWGVILGLTIAVLIGTAALLALSHSNSAARQQRLVVSSYEILGTMQQTVVALQDSELGQRAYLGTGQASDLEPYDKARLRIEGGLRQLEGAVAGDPDTARQVREFRAAATEKLGQINATIATYQLYGREAALAQQRDGSGRVT
ncbi:MAG: CHASE3 domain-containing protein, partial [Proteobacteria bacterium]|nr:CHASE3 domain-containing protein [Pseudomonadota bacterium]